MSDEVQGKGTRGRKPSQVWNPDSLEKALKAFDNGEGEFPGKGAEIVQSEVMADNGARIATPRIVQYGPVFRLTADGLSAEVLTLRYVGRNRVEDHKVHATLKAVDFAPKSE